MLYNPFKILLAGYIREHSLFFLIAHCLLFLESHPIGFFSERSRLCLWVDDDINTSDL